MPFATKEDQAAYHRAWYAKNKERRRQLIREYRQRLKEEIQKLKESPCYDCGNSYPYWVMDFDHREDKLFSIADSVPEGRGRLQILAEIAKCDLVCANCHRNRTHMRTHSSS